MATYTYGQTIHDQLMEDIQNEIGVAAAMGNLYAESGLIPHRVQGDFSSGYSYSVQYTAQVDSGAISEYNFVHNGPNGGGYGLAQWTYYTRKQALYNMKQSMGVSIGSVDLACAYLLHELKTSYGSVYNALRNATSISTATVKFMLDFENPADQSTAAQNTRIQYAQEMYDTYYQEYAWPCPTTATITSYYGYRTPPTSGASSFHAAIDIATADGSPVISIADGTVYQISSYSTRGNYVRILHPNGLVSHYQHLQGAVSSLRVGHKVVKSEQIAISGHTGIGTGPHTDVRIYRSVNTVDKDNGITENGATYNPLDYLTPKAGGVVYPPGTGEGGGDVPENVSFIRWIPA